MLATHNEPKMLCHYPFTRTRQHHHHHHHHHHKNPPERELRQHLERRKSSGMTPEVILVVCSHQQEQEEEEEECVNLVKWAIEVAAEGGGGGAIVVMKLGGDWDGIKIRKLSEECEEKEVKLEVRLISDSSQILQQASIVQATMLVTQPDDDRQSLRCLPNMAPSLPSFCSLAIVKHSTLLSFIPHPSLRNVSSLHLPPSTQQPSASSHCSSPLLLHDTASDSISQPNMQLHSIHHHHHHPQSSPLPAGGCSPTAVLDSFELSCSESDTSSPSSSHTHRTLSQSLSRKGLLSCVSSSQQHQEEEEQRDDDTEINSKERPNYLRRKMFIHRSSTFPTNCRLKKCSSPLDCKLMRGTFKAYLNSLCSTESMSHDPWAPSILRVEWRSFSYAELAVATGRFDPVNVVGRGGQAEVYKGKLQDGRLVAVKRIIQNFSEDIKEKEFLSELGIIGHVSHPNTVALVGFCVEGGLYLIFEYSSHGSLSTLLHCETQPLLAWSLRFKVAVGIARGLHYLHTGCPRRIIHRDVKASNILLDDEFEPRISDFGLAKWLPGECTQLNVFPVEGTFGYLAPEYFMYGIVNEKTDVFAFGVLLLELITGRQPINHNQQSLVMWARPLLDSMRIEELVDRRLVTEAYDTQQMHNMVIAASLCVQSSAICRPHMDQVLELLITGRSSEACCIPSQDSCEEGYSSSDYLSDLSRHREVALESEEL